MASTGLDLRLRSPFLLERIREVEGELADWAHRRPSFDFEVEGTELLPIMELLYGYAKRAHDLAAAARALMALERLTPAAILARALIETTAIGCLYVKEMRRLVDGGELAPLRARFRRYSDAAGDAPVEEALRYLAALDGAQFTATRSAEAQALGGLDLGDPKFVETSYQLLGEASHPGSAGGDLLHAAAGEPEIDEPRLRLEFAVELAIWHGRYLLAALEEGESLPKTYRERFMSIPPPRRGATSAGDRRRTPRSAGRERPVGRDRAPPPGPQ
jgi:hypothetical protein